MKRLAWFAILSLGGLLPAGCAREQPVSAPRGFHPAQKWEYKVVKIEKDEERDLTTVLNIQAKDGWEYNGQITTDGHYLVFQRSTGQVGHPGTKATARATAVKERPPATKAVTPKTEPTPTESAVPVKDSPKPDVKKSPEPVKPPQKN